MGKIVVTEFISLDGVFEDPGGAEGYQHGGWSFTFDQGADGAKFKLDELMAADAQLLGRVTYERFAKAWPANQDPVGFASKMNAMPKYVVSATLTDPAWNNTTVITLEEAGKLKDQYQGDILVAGSGQVVRGLTGLGPGGRVPADGLPAGPGYRQAPVRRRSADTAEARRRHQHRPRRRDHPALHAGRGLTGPGRPDPSG